MPAFLQAAALVSVSGVLMAGTLSAPSVMMIAALYEPVRAPLPDRNTSDQTRYSASLRFVTSPMYGSALIADVT
jgi:hypothetical protein